MRHFTKDEQKKYTESISKLYKPTGVNIMADKINDKLKWSMGAKELREIGDLVLEVKQNDRC